MKVDFRRTMSHLALEETSNKQIDFQKQLYNYMRNDQICELSQKIKWAEQNKETSGDFLADMTSVSGFKSAVSFLFNSITEAMATATRMAREVTVLGILWTIQPSKFCSLNVSHV